MIATIAIVAVLSGKGRWITRPDQLFGILAFTSIEKEVGILLCYAGHSQGCITSVPQIVVSFINREGFAL